MAKLPTGLRAEIMADIAEKYSEYKNMRFAIKERQRKELEQEMEQAYHEFSEYLQSILERDDVKITVTDMATSMQTSNRNTVYDFLGDARARKKNRFLANTLKNRVEIIFSEVMGADTNSPMARLGVKTGDETYMIHYKLADGGSAVYNYTPWDFESMTATGKRVPRFLPVGSDTAEKGAVPDWLEYALNTSEWKSIAPNF